ncbi:MAG: hypothetical protein OEZ68_17050 [Gammaproteobacteria bacterium]|nr:hypothetical protein [Gammaproteobacteria bacterium]MDH5802511.1 hypothetical protein [Gammaproteobacteria bacterium]
MLGIFGDKRSVGGQELLQSLRLPPCANKFDPSLEPGPVLQSLAKQQHVYLLVSVRDYVAKLNRVIVAPSKRLDIVERCLALVGPPVRKILIEYSKTQAIPESQARSESLLAAASCLKQLSISLKRLLKNDLCASRHNKTLRKRIVKSAVYYFEVLAVEQRLIALRYEQWPDHIWLDCNAIYFALADSEDVDKLNELGLSILLSVNSATETAKLSLTGLYFAIQLFGFMDPNTLSPEQLQLLDYTLKSRLGDLQILADDDTPLGEGQLLVYRNLDRPPLLDRTGGSYEDARILDLRPLLNVWQLNYEIYANKFKGRGEVLEMNSNVHGVLEREDMERILALESVLRCFKIQQRNETRRYRDEAPSYVFLGYSKCFSLLNSGNDPEAESAEQLRNSLAQSSASISPTAGSGESARWVIINESSKGMLLQTAATQYISHIFIGQLLALAQEREQLRYPIIAYVTRIVRAGENKIQLAVKRLSSQVSCVVVQNDFLQKNNMGLPGLLILDSGEGLRLLVHQSHRLGESQEIAIKRGGKLFRTTVQSTQLMRREFIVYQLSEAKYHQDAETQEIELADGEKLEHSHGEDLTEGRGLTEEQDFTED